LLTNKPEALQIFTVIQVKAMWKKRILRCLVFTHL